MTTFSESARQPKVTCLECGTMLGEGTTKDVFSHLVVCLKVAPNSLDNIRDNAEAMRSEYGKRVLHIVNALQRGVEQPVAEVNE